MVECHHRETVAHESVVCVVPLRSLGVHPDPTTRYEGRELRQGRDHELLEEVDQDWLAHAVGDELAVCSHIGDSTVNQRGDGFVVFDCRFGVLDELFMRREAIGNVGVAEPALTEHLLDGPREVFEGSGE